MPQAVRGKAKCVIGLDVDEAACGNSKIDEFRKLEICRPWPVESETCEVVLCDYVIEHLPVPDGFFSEARRVLKPKGVLCIRTPNVFSYFGLASVLVPNRLHTSILRVSQPDRKAEDVFPTLYRCNTHFAMRGALIRHGFDPVVFGHDAEPAYLAFSPVAYYFGVLHQRLAPSFLRTSLFAFGSAR